jgi:protein-tyrosine phosphatase
VKTILFVCTANICRSPMAAAIMRQRLADLGLDQEVEVLSAGVYAEAGLPASGLAVTTLAGHAIPLEEHRSQPLVPALLQQADVVLVMEEAHRRSIFYLTPQHLGKVYLLSELAGRHDDVADPFGRPPEAYERTVALLEGLIDVGMPRLLRQLKLPENGSPRVETAAPAAGA